MNTTRTLFTIGYGGRKYPQELVDLLRQDGVQTVVDVRIDPSHAYMSFYAKARNPQAGIVGLLAGSGIGYAWLPELGNPFLDDDTWREQYAELPEREGNERTAALRQMPGALCLLCCEKDPAKCHRRLIAEYLKQCYGWRYDDL